MFKYSQFGKYLLLNSFLSIIFLYFFSSIFSSNEIKLDLKFKKWEKQIIQQKYIYTVLMDERANKNPCKYTQLFSVVHLIAFELKLKLTAFISKYDSRIWFHTFIYWLTVKILSNANRWFSTLSYGWWRWRWRWSDKYDANYYYLHCIGGCPLSFVQHFAQFSAILKRFTPY